MSGATTRTAQRTRTRDAGAPLLEVRGLTVEFRTSAGVVRAVTLDPRLEQWLGTKAVGDEAIAARLAERAGIVVAPGDLYGEAGAAHARLALTQPTARLELALGRLAASA